MMCAHCEGRVKKALEALPGVTEARADHTKGEAAVWSAAPLAESAVREAVTKAGYEYAGTADAPQTEETTLTVKGMMCAHCEGRVKKALEALPGIQKAEADHTKDSVKVTYTGKLPLADVRDAISKAGYELQ